jgi:hypothetical protein
VFTDRTVRYRWHPLHSRSVFVFAAVEKGNDRVIRCALEPSHTARPLEIPELVFGTVWVMFHMNQNMMSMP